MDVSVLISFLLGLPVAVLATLQVLDWRKKRRAGKQQAPQQKQAGRDPLLKDEDPPTPADQAIAAIICQAELAAEIDRQIAEELSRYEVESRHGKVTENSLPHSK